MAQVSFNQLAAEAEKQANNPQTNNNNFNSVSFFSLKNDGEKAFVRFILDDPDNDLECLTTHEIYVGGKARKISCLRTSANEPVDKCPICKLTSGIKSRAYVRMIQYTRSEDGKSYIASPKVWERSIPFITKTIMPFKEFYPDGISKAIFQITRIGKAGSKDTTYSIIPIPNVSPELQAKCVLDKSLFKNYKALGTIVIDKSYNEMVEALKKGEYQVRTTNQTSTSAETDVAVPKTAPVVTQAAPTVEAPATNNEFVSTIAYNTDDMPF